MKTVTVTRRKPANRLYMAISSILGLFIILFLIISASDLRAEATANAKPRASDVQEYVLDNGLKILVKEDQRAPVAVVQLWYKVGATYEYGGLTGVSHILEHMMFKGTKEYATGEFNRILDELGAQDNAFTSTDYTAYYQVLANEHIETAMKLEADRMRGLVLSSEEFVKELEVVKEERRLRTEDNPNGRLREHFMAAAFENNPYRQPIIGWMNDIENIQLQDLQDWYEKWYAPNNAILVVVGDVKAEEVKTLAQKYYGSIEKSEITPPKPRKDAPQKGEKRIVVKAPANVARLMMGFKTPALVDLMGTEQEWEPYALEVLASVLSGGSSSRFVRDLIRDEQLAASAYAWYSGYGRLSNLFSFSAVPATDVSIETLETALMKQIEQMQTEQITPEELARVKAQVIAEQTFGLDDIQQQATLLGSLESVGLGYELMDEYVEKIMAITPEQVQQVAQRYLLRDQLTVGVLDPQSIAEQAQTTVHSDAVAAN